MSTSAQQAAQLAAAEKMLAMTLGAVEVGVLASTLLFGIVCVQLHFYFRKFSNDPWFTKLMVIFIGLLELGHTICICIELYTATVTFYGRLDQMLRWPSLIASMIPSALIAIIVQIFFISRIQKFSGHSLIPILCWLSCLVRLSLTIGGTVRAFQANTLPEFMSEYSWLLIIVLSISAFVDIMIAATLSWTLISQKDGSTSKESGRIIDKLIGWSIRNGLVTSIASITVIICFTTMPHNFVFIAVYAIVARLYSISLLSSLNSRTKLRRTMGLTDPIQMTPTNSSGRRSTAGGPHTDSQSRTVIVDTTIKPSGTGARPIFYDDLIDHNQETKQVDIV